MKPVVEVARSSRESVADEVANAMGKSEVLLACACAPSTPRGSVDQSASLRPFAHVGRARRDEKDANGVMLCPLGERESRNRDAIDFRPRFQPECG